MHIRNFGTALVLAAATLFAASAQATPYTYFLTSGQVTVTATVGGFPVAGPAVVTLSGVSVTIDESSLGLNSLVLSIGSSGSVAISPSYLGYTSINIDFATLTASGGSLSLFDPGPPAGYSYSIGPVAVAGQFDAINTNPIFNITNSPFGFANPTATGTVYVDTGVAIALDGITLGSIDPDGPGGAPPLVLKGDFLFEGSAPVIPEPGTALLLGLGLAGVASIRRRS